MFIVKNKIILFVVVFNFIISMYTRLNCIFLKFIYIEISTEVSN